MHPNEMKNRAFAAAVSAEADGQFATAVALRQLAAACAEEAAVLAASLRSYRRDDAATACADPARFAH